MKLVIIEPLGVNDEKLLSMAKDMLPADLEIVYYNTRVTDTETLIERGRDADIIAVSNLPMNADVINGCKNLKMLSVAFTGVDHIAMDACKANGVLVSNCAGYSTAAVADLVFGMIIALYRNMIPCNDVVRKEGTKDGLVGFELEGKKFGVIGTGAIGLRTAAIANAFGCQVLAYSRTKKDIPGITYVDMDTLLSSCDIVSLHTPLNSDTRGLIGKEELAKMKPSAILINTSRGPVVDSAALADALNNGRLAGAGIDVFETEPPIAKDHPLLTAKNVIATPHVAFATKEALEKRAVIVFDNVDKWLKGTPQNVM
ncbi:hydroxyacid dehydrogenase [Lachnospiraceae bacterium BX10]|uniref:Hydroxyacid dehydrogenase n=1 Tax=Enterocloster hominis (ex Liu et al. 2021) TaxID=2763663 RepID=A0ABR7NTJ5_9FIRM|nr:2-hydroxyacid dehydrogenase [Enterocloster hominis]MBC8598886.1 hydroxyacid dehydrogenase [Enterocloster hominis]CDC48757.1 4-phosphoerythronate dehydrogenase [Clostridium sp. CAG:58]